MRCRELAGSVRTSLYCGLRILPSPLLALGYDNVFLSSAMSKLFDRSCFGMEDGNRLGVEPTLSSPELYSNWDCRFFLFCLLWKFAMLGSPNSSSSSSYRSPSSSSAASVGEIKDQECD